jgi:hypothetical protein
MAAAEVVSEKAREGQKGANHGRKGPSQAKKQGLSWEN